MLSRVANLIYWMARYLERAENTARLVDVNAALVVDLQSRRAADDPKSWEPMVYVGGNEERFFELYGKGGVTEENVITFMLFDRRNAGSAISCIAQARENARCIRDQLSSEVWEQLNFCHLELQDHAYHDYQRHGSAEYLNRLKQYLQLFHGIAESMLPRNQAWWFYEFGRLLERADNTSRIIDVKYFTLLPGTRAVGSALDLIQWASVLRSCSGYEAFRKSRRGQLTLERVVDYLLLDPFFPRSIRFSVDGAGRALEQILADLPHHATNDCSRQLAALRIALAHADIDGIIAGGLHEYLDEVQSKIADIHEAMRTTFIDYPTAEARVLN